MRSTPENTTAERKKTTLTLEGVRLSKCLTCKRIETEFWIRSPFHMDLFLYNGFHSTDTNVWLMKAFIAPLKYVKCTRVLEKYCIYSTVCAVTRINKCN